MRHAEVVRRIEAIWKEWEVIRETTGEQYEQQGTHRFRWWDGWECNMNDPRGSKAKLVAQLSVAVVTDGKVTGYPSVTDLPPGVARRYAEIRDALDAWERNEADWPLAKAVQK